MGKQPKPLLQRYERERNAPPYLPPTDEQLANFACVVVNGEAARAGIAAVLTPHLALLTFRADSRVREGWRRKHREFQEIADTKGER